MELGPNGELPWTEWDWHANEHIPPPASVRLSVYRCLVCDKQSQLFDNETKLGCQVENVFRYVHAYCGGAVAVAGIDEEVDREGGWTPGKLVQVQEALSSELAAAVEKYRERANA